MNEADIIRAALATLEPLGFKATWQQKNARAKGPNVDGFARLARGKTTQDVVLEFKRGVTPATLGAVLAQTRAQAAAYGKPVVLITHHVTPPVERALRAADQQFIDTAGNAYLAAPGWLVNIVGHRPAQALVPTHAGKGGTPAGLKVLFALLCDTKLVEEPLRTIAANANVALGAVTAILNDLKDRGHLVMLPGVRRLQPTKRLLNEWAMAYARTLRPKTLIAAYDAHAPDTWKEWVLDAAHQQWGGEPAAALLTHHLRPEVLTIYGDKLPPKLLVGQRLRAIAPGDAGLRHAQVELRRRFWGQGLTVRLEEQGIAPTTVPPVLIYADLLATGDARCIETAEILYEQTIARLLKLD